MYCRNCGSQIYDKATVCPHCGRAVYDDVRNAGVNNRCNYGYGQTEILSLTGFVLSFIIQIAGLIVSVIAYNRAKGEGVNTSFAKAGIIISAVLLALQIIAAAAAIALWVMFFTSSVHHIELCALPLFM